MTHPESLTHPDSPWLPKIPMAPSDTHVTKWIFMLKEEPSFWKHCIIRVGLKHYCKNNCSLVVWCFCCCNGCWSCCCCCWCCCCDRWHVTGVIGDIPWENVLTSCFSFHRKTTNSHFFFIYKITYRSCVSIFRGMVLDFAISQISF